MTSGMSSEISGHSAGIEQSSIRNRLLYVVGQLRIGGLERQLYYLLANLDPHLHRPAVFVWNLDHRDRYYRDIKSLNIPVYGFPREFSSLSKLQGLRALARKVVPEVIHSYSFFTNFAAYYAAWGTRAVSIGSIRGDYARAKAESGFIKGGLNAQWPHYHISNSQKSADAAGRSSNLFTSRKLFVVRNGLDMGEFGYVDHAPGERHYIAAVGSLFPVKRWDRLLRAIQMVKKVVREDVHFRIAGEGPLRPVLEKQAEDLRISQSVEFLGAIHDIPAFLRGAKFLVHTSESEGCPNVVMESMACGRAIVAMDAGDIPYLVESGKTGFVVQQGDEGALVESVSRLLRDEEQCIRMGRAARATAEREFGIERLVSETLNVYRIAGWRG